MGKLLRLSSRIERVVKVLEGSLLLSLEVAVIFVGKWTTLHDIVGVFSGLK